MEFSLRDYKGFATIDLKGKLTGGPQAETFREIFRSHVQQGKRFVILNFRDVEWISSAGVGVLIRAYKMVRDAGGDFAIVRVGERTRQVFDVLRLDHVFAIMADEDEAASRLGKEAAARGRPGGRP